MIIVNSAGRSFFVHTVMKGERYGLNNCLVHENADPMIEFYDYKYAGERGFTPRGQFVSRYFASTLATHTTGAGLMLDGANRDVWTIDGAAFAPVIDLAKRICAPRTGAE
jgi:hypothetical protein